MYASFRRISWINGKEIGETEAIIQRSVCYSWVNLDWLFFPLTEWFEEISLQYYDLKRRIWEMGQWIWEYDMTNIISMLLITPSMKTYRAPLWVPMRKIPLRFQYQSKVLLLLYRHNDSSNPYVSLFVLVPGKFKPKF